MYSPVQATMRAEQMLRSATSVRMAERVQSSTIQHTRAPDAVSSTLSRRRDTSNRVSFTPGKEGEGQLHAWGRKERVSFTPGEEMKLSFISFFISEIFILLFKERRGIKCLWCCVESSLLAKNEEEKNIYGVMFNCEGEGLAVFPRRRW